MLLKRLFLLLALALAAAPAAPSPLTLLGAGGAGGAAPSCINSAGTSLLLFHGDGADASTTITDSSASAHTFTVVGNTQIDTAQSQFGGSSILFDGTGDRLDGDASADFAFATGDFTLDFWVRYAAVSAADVLYDSRPTGTTGIYPMIYSGTSTWAYHVNGTDRIIATTSIATNTWYYIEVTRSGTSTRLFIDGTQEGSTYSDSNNYINGTARPRIADSGFTAGAADLSGWIDEMHVMKTAGHTSNYTRPTLPYCN